MDGTVEFSGSSASTSGSGPDTPDDAVGAGPMGEQSTPEYHDAFSTPAIEEPGLFEEEQVVASSDLHSTNSSDMSDIASFGNSQDSGSRDGSLRYNITVAGIDTSDVRESFREAITDARLVWDIEQILRSVKHGEVRFTNVSPAKAFVVILRLRGLPLQVKWEQYAISQS